MQSDESGKMTKDIQEIEITKSDGNVFADLAWDNPDELKSKAKIAASINPIIQQRGLQPAEASKILNITTVPLKFDEI